ncbi:type I restriction endonuclease [Rodentibacter trehalosifermentans]|uniref:Type I restriction endonuclease n=1 Tax=Rodentibacter trehalosifermentans TaxID=1908263 RepID=A0A1V3J079_9PAST|nr:restriction endonuclease subunit S [Rodentibacter trehalosifermentans]OOF47849.1 type I restriction endonuclease [Rodentibacter trehalosifermentans]
MSKIEWIETTVGEYCPFIYGKALPQSKRISGDVPVYGSNGVVDFHNSSCVDSAGIIIGRKGSVGAVHLSEKPFWVIDTAFYVLNDDIEELKFTYYLLKTLGLSEMNSDSAVPGLNRENAHSLKIRIPKDKVHRCEIGRKLSIFDKKIQLNTQINQTLEQIAQAIFKSWFVDFDPVRAKADSLAQGKTQAEAELAAQQIISGKTPEELTALSQTHPAQYAELAEMAKAFPSEFEEVEGFGEVPRGWEKTTLSEICEMQNGYAFKSSDWTERGIPVIKIGSIKPIIVEVEGNGFVSNEYQNLRPDFLLTSGDILVGLTGYVGEVGRIPQGKVAMLNQRVAKFLPKEIDKNHNFYNYIYCLARQKQFKEFAEMNSKGSAQANISTKELLKFPIIRANKECHILFENKIQAILEKILVNSQNSEELASVRDLLLPRLLSGEFNE